MEFLTNDPTPPKLNEAAGSRVIEIITEISSKVGDGGPLNIRSDTIQSDSVDWLHF